MGGPNDITRGRTALSASPSRKTRASSPMPASATRTARCSPA